jgi:hypothetical protein
MKKKVKTLGVILLAMTIIALAGVASQRRRIWEDGGWMLAKRNR